MMSRLRPITRVLSDLTRCRTMTQKHLNSAIVYNVSCHEYKLYSQFNIPDSKLFHSTKVPLAQESSEQEENINSDVSVKSEDTFASLLRHSAFMQIGNPVGKVRKSSKCFWSGPINKKIILG